MSRQKRQRQRHPSPLCRGRSQDKANRKLYKTYYEVSAAIWLSLERQQHCTQRCHSNSKTKLLPPILRFSSSSWCECFTASRSCPYTCFFALKRPCKGPLTPGFLNLSAILTNSFPGHPPPLYTRKRPDGFRFSEVHVLCVYLFERCTFKSHLTFGASVRPENAVTYSVGLSRQRKSKNMWRFL